MAEQKRGRKPRSRESYMQEAKNLRAELRVAQEQIDLLSSREEELANVIRSKETTIQARNREVAELKNALSAEREMSGSLRRKLKDTEDSLQTANYKVVAERETVSVFEQEVERLYKRIESLDEALKEKESKLEYERGRKDGLTMALTTVVKAHELP